MEKFSELFQQRVERYRQLALKEGIEASLVLKPENRYYLSGFRGSAGFLVIDREKVFLLVDFRYVEQAREQAPGAEVVCSRRRQERDLSEFLLELGYRAVRIEEDGVTVKQLRDWQEALGGKVELIPAEDLTLGLRAVKDPQEIEWMRRAASIADQAFEQILPRLAPGRREQEIAAELEFIMRTLGAERAAFDIIVASGFRSALPHGAAGEKPLRPGELVIVDFGAVYRGYCSDCTRTLVMGEAMTPEQRAVCEIVREAQETALRLLRPGGHTAEVDKAAREVIQGHGYGDYFGHALGHGVGLEVHEGPVLSWQDGGVLEAGMVVTVEPAIYLPGWGGVRLEEMVLITETGCEILTRAPRLQF